MPGFEPIKKTAIAEEVTTRLLSLIREKYLNPGDRLPPERELAAAMEVSRPSLPRGFAGSVYDERYRNQAGRRHLRDLS